MPRYFFNIRDHETIEDVAGIELPDVAAAKAQAEELARLSKNLMPGLPFRIIVTDERKEVVAQIVVDQ